MGQLDRLPERQRLLAEATGEYETNPARALELMERMLERYPDEEEAYDLIVHVYTFTQDPRLLEAARSHSCSAGRGRFQGRDPVTFTTTTDTLCWRTDSMPTLKRSSAPISA